MGAFIADVSTLLNNQMAELCKRRVMLPLWTQTGDSANLFQSTSVSFELKDDLHVVGRFVLSLLPGCSEICVSHSAHINPAYRNRGLGTLFHELRLEIARYWGCVQMIATDDMANSPQAAILKKHRWRKLLMFHNPYTSNTVNLRSKALL